MSDEFARIYSTKLEHLDLQRKTGYHTISLALRRSAPRASRSARSKSFGPSCLRLSVVELLQPRGSQPACYGSMAPGAKRMVSKLSAATAGMAALVLLGGGLLVCTGFICACVES